MVLEPEGVNSRAGLDKLAAFGRTRTSVTGLSAIVPNTMVIIDDSMQQTPNMYDGLPRHSKVLYLMTTLNASQWGAITGGGIGISDLNADQKAVFTSIMPKPFKYSTYTVKNLNSIDPGEQGIELSDSDLQSVRLHIERSLNFMMPIVGQPNSLSPRDTSSDYGKPGRKVIERDGNQDFRKQDSFGMKIRLTELNQQKPSDLDYRASSLQGSLQLNPSESLSELLKRIGVATGLELYADLRVGDRKMMSIGRSAPISSVLRIIALSVTGTYRKVGSAYILTSDLVGIGTRKMKLAAYDEELNAKLWNEESEWRHQIYLSGHLSQIGFRADDQLLPGDSLAKKMDHGSPGRGTKISASDLSEGLKQFIQRENDICQTQQVTAEGATVQSAHAFSFILPNGDETRSEFESLGQHDLFVPPTGNPPRQEEMPAQPKVDVNDIKEPLFLCIRADTVDAARHAVDLALRYGLKELWLDTVSADVLAAGVKAGSSSSLKVSLALRPFDYRGTEDSLSADRTLFGDSPPESLQRRMASAEWAQLLKKGIDINEVAGPISPLSAGCLMRRRVATEMALTPGLGGLHVLNSTPNGYNGPRVNYLSFPQPIYLEKGNFGYAEDLRLAFIREAKVDPIDLCPPNINTNADLRQPFFLDDLLRGGSSIYDGTDEPNPAMEHMMANFDTWLAKLHHSSLRTLLDDIAKANPNLPISVDAIPLQMNAVNRFGGGLVAWRSGDPLPELADARQGFQPDIRKYVVRTRVSESGPDFVHMGLVYFSKNPSDGPQPAGFILDLTALTPSHVDKWMAETFLVRPLK